MSTKSILSGGNGDLPRDLNPEQLGSVDELRQLLYKKARVSRRLSWLLDDCIRIPGTGLRFGLDPLLGLIPYGGETVATLFGAMILGEAGRKGLPLRSLVRMGANMLLNAAIGVVPLVGDLFSFWFKSNARNYNLLATELAEQGVSFTPEEMEKPGFPWFAVGLIVLVLVVIALVVGGLLYWICSWWQ